MTDTSKPGISNQLSGLCLAKVCPKLWQQKRILVKKYMVGKQIREGGNKIIKQSN